MNESKNEQLDLALNFIEFTDKNIFLTGKAGTGKTTFLHHLKKSSQKRLAVVAPTGIAAINAGGVTIHSFFQLPFGPYIPGNRKETVYRRFAKDKINLIKSLDLLIIDEISMVRADTLDSIDEVLRRYRDRNRPFGGTQLLLIGDLHQLSPVVKDEDWLILKGHYPSLYFFNSKALQKTSPVTIELKHIYRQRDQSFIDLLNSVRDNRVTPEILNYLNQRYIPGFNPADDEGYITLATHNRTANDINEQRLLNLTDQAQVFHARIKGDFPEYAYPNATELTLKKHAQVMFIKNDPTRERQYYNGKIGRITRIEEETIYVLCPGESQEIGVNPVEWENIRYELNPDTREVEEKNTGSFVQYPLKLAWAVTIHKSQGLTFEKAIIDANASFAHGQVYVALSRCKSFEGIVLRSPISFNSIKTDGDVTEYTRNADLNAPDNSQLLESKRSYQRELLLELFDFNDIQSGLHHCKKVLQDHDRSFSPAAIAALENIHSIASKEIYDIAAILKKQLQSLNTGVLPEENPKLQERIRKACNYFSEKTATIITETISKLNVDSDNKAARTSIKDAIDTLNKALFVKDSVLKICIEGFKTLHYLQTRANSEVAFKTTKISHVSAASARNDISNPVLYATLKRWRDDEAGSANVPVYLVLPQNTIAELSGKLPSSMTELESVKGMGKQKIKRYGSEILEMINSYCRDHGVERVEEPVAITKEKKKIKPDTNRVSYDLFRSGRTIAEIAAERMLTTGTIENHLASFISGGELSVFELVSKVKVARIMACKVQNNTASMSELKAVLGDDISYAEIRAVLGHLLYIKESAEEVSETN